MKAGKRGTRACARVVGAAFAIALAGVAASVPPAWAGQYDTVGADDKCIERADSFRDLDGNGCPEPILAAGDVKLRFLAKGSGAALRVTVESLTVSAPKEATVLPSCTPRCGGRSHRIGGGRFAVSPARTTFRRGEVVGVRIWQDGYVGRFYGYRIGTRHPKYMACFLRSADGPPKRCHT